MSNEQIKSDTLTLLLAYHMHKHKPVKELMFHIRRCVEILLARTVDPVMIETYRNILRGYYARQYANIAIMLNITDNNYCKVYIK
ncbi:MAG: hypothetical protein MJK15_00630 [Colwellia sp.]|nr:hypothetical protein [Colwellia sp.]